MRFALLLLLAAACGDDHEVDRDDASTDAAAADGDVEDTGASDAAQDTSVPDDAATEDARTDASDPVDAGECAPIEGTTDDPSVLKVDLELNGGASPAAVRLSLINTSPRWYSMYPGMVLEVRSGEALLAYPESEEDTTDRVETQLYAIMPCDTQTLDALLVWTEGSEATLAAIATAEVGSVDADEKILSLVRDSDGVIHVAP